ncbi:hypothetical protein DL240_10700 [Lujinxingia litoralis]|uniref:Uncharacterized protein n=1 Tax=Lujinxingia litoralis TaxID=2211119 RepID=A0A328C667_9DELT|nr:FAD-dependent oxidoreductase [Lujinxingia litoralis]RAL22312.1 hypothetical protein DL240_10700 [Lujinxingia litoralis]
MSSTSRFANRRLAIIGAGPIGVETALRALAEGLTVTLYEAREPGAHVRRWSHVRFFSPWSLNRSALGEAMLREAGRELVDGEVFPTGESYLREYLEPLLAELDARPGLDLQPNTRVLGISRLRALKGDLLANPRRAHRPFLLRVSGPEGERFDEADLVIDASGVLSTPNMLGPGGLPAIGEEALNGQVLRGIPDVTERDADLANRRVLVVGDGHSAATTLGALTELRTRAPQTRVVWAYRSDGEPFVEIEGDTLPQRLRLSRLGNAVARGEVDGVEARPGVFVQRISPEGDALRVTLASAGGDTSEVEVDRIIANVGYHPDTSLYRELQVHLCYASDGPMKLAASLLASTGGADCLDQTSAGPEVLKNPEPGFYVLGTKSYGRNSNFLLKVGLQQIDDVMTLIRDSQDV